MKIVDFWTLDLSKNDLYKMQTINFQSNAKTSHCAMICTIKYVFLTVKSGVFPAFLKNEEAN